MTPFIDFTFCKRVQCQHYDTNLYHVSRNMLQIPRCMMSITSRRKHMGEHEVPISCPFYLETILQTAGEPSHTTRPSEFSQEVTP